MQPGMAIGMSQVGQRLFQAWSDTLLLNMTRSNANRTVDESTSSNAAAMTFRGRASGKLYWELALSASGLFNMAAGIRRDDEAIGTAINLGKTCAMRSTNALFTGDTGATTGTGATFATSDTLMLALDMAIGATKLWIGVNGTWSNSGDPAAGSGALFAGFPAGVWHPYVWTDNDTGNHTITINSGHAAFTYAMPAGFEVFKY